MYLKASKYLAGGWNHSSPKQKKTFDAVCSAAGITKKALCAQEGGMEISWSVGYWRKANAIHAWFVENVQDGKDDCQTSYVDRDTLKKLLAVCKEVVKTKNWQLLSPQGGFFFGTTEIDESYWYQIDLTIKQLKAILSNKELKDCEFTYRASW